MRADDPFKGLRVPGPPPELRRRVLDAERLAGLRDEESLLDRLAGSRAWWLSWAATIVLLFVLQGTSPAPEIERSGLRQWQERLRRVEAELGLDRVPSERSAEGREEPS